MNSNKSPFIIEHDFIIAIYMADRVIMFTGRPEVKTTVMASMIEGMNIF